MDTLLFNLKPFKLIVFPNWSQAESSIYSDLQKLITALLTHPEKNNIALLIDVSNIDSNSHLDDVNLILSDIIINLLMEEDINHTTEPDIILLEKRSPSFWSNILPHLYYRIKLTSEDEEALAYAGAETIQVIELDRLSELPLQLKPSLLREIGDCLYQESRYEEAIEHYQKFLGIQVGDIELYFNFSECLRELKRSEDAIAILEQGICHYPTAGKLHFSLIKILHQNAQTQEAILSAKKASDLLPNEYVFCLLKHLTLPIIYCNADEINFYRQEFIRSLENLIQSTSITTPEERRKVFLGLGSFTNFYLAYQAHNVVESQIKYGNFVHQVMAAKYPKWVLPKPMPALPANGKIRVGYISSYLHSYSGTLWLIGWLRYCNKEKIEVYSYHIGNYSDAITSQFQEYSNVFHHIPDSLEAVCEQIIDDNLHILVFPEIGMDAPTIRIAALRLAPVQCSAWGHPVTSGLPTIDYFISSELMEPENAQEHYSETLIRLPNIGVAYPKPIVGKLTNTRSDFNLQENSIIYLCCQAPFKYLPQYDYILAEIACRVPQAQFIFPRGELLHKRLECAFSNVNLNYLDYCLFLPLATRQEYIAINFLSDVFLDTFTWSGGNTSLEAIACNLPLVTCPGEFMRGLHAYSFLKMLGVTDTIAQNEKEYIEIAVKLGLDPNWRRNISKRMSQQQDNLFDDKVCVVSLENFYQEVVQERIVK